MPSQRNNLILMHKYGDILGPSFFEVTLLKSKKSCGYNEIMIQILKIISPFIVSPLTYIHNRMLSTGTFPDRLKFSEIKPIYKKGDKTLITNYRPMSLLPVFSKIYEKIIYKRLYYHLTSNNILAKEQYGFNLNSYIYIT
jgi:hypothetical protein